MNRRQVIQLFIAVTITEFIIAIYYYTTAATTVVYISCDVVQVLVLNSDMFLQAFAM